MIRITRKKIVFQSGQCTYTDLDVLFRYSKEIFFGFNREQIFYIFKIVFVCSTTIVYLAMTSYVFTTILFYMKYHFASKLNFNQEVIPKNNITNENCTNQAISNRILLPNYSFTNRINLKQQCQNRQNFQDFPSNYILNENNPDLNCLNKRNWENRSFYLNEKEKLFNNNEKIFKSKIKKLIQVNTLFIKDSNQKYIVSLDRVKFSEPLVL